MRTQGSEGLLAEYKSKKESWWYRNYVAPFGMKFFRKDALK